MVCHRKDYVQWENGNVKVNKLTSFDIFDEYGIENCQIVLIETFPCSSRDELNARESYYIRSLNCVNKVILGRTKE
jgi:ribosome-interacting GTPase 1